MIRGDLLAVRCVFSAVCFGEGKELGRSKCGRIEVAYLCMRSGQLVLVRGAMGWVGAECDRHAAYNTVSTTVAIRHAGVPNPKLRVFIAAIDAAWLNEDSYPFF